MICDQYEVADYLFKKRIIKNDFRVSTESYLPH
uniref:Uncharacterized protein n=1 Tax=Arundo donax TaxID=35708 RepID=A0A0A9B5P5_ARUDO